MVSEHISHSISRDIELLSPLVAGFPLIPAMIAISIQLTAMHYTWKPAQSHHTLNE